MRFVQRTFIGRAASSECANPTSCHVYEYLQDSKWLELDAAAIGEKFTIKESFVLVQQA